MTKRIACRELGVENCNFTASGETAGEVVREVVDHLRVKHDIDMPDAGLILAGEVKEDSPEFVDPAAGLIAERLTEALGIVPTEEPATRPEPSLGVTPTA